MKIKWGALVVDGRNKIGGHVASKNRAGAYLRTKVTPVNPESTYQINVRNRLAGRSSAWKGLTDANRLAWNSAVADYASTDIFGDLRNPSGFNLHQKLNNNLLNIGESAIPAPLLPQAVAAFTFFNLTADVGLQAIVLQFAPIVDANHKVLVFATPCYSPGISFVKSEYRQIEVLPASTASNYSIKDSWVAKYGESLLAGMKVSVRLVQVRIATGQAGIPIQATLLIEA